MKINEVSYLNNNRPFQAAVARVSKRPEPAEQAPKHSFPDPKVFDIDGNGKVEILDFIPESLNLKTSKVSEAKQKVLSEYVEVENNFPSYEKGGTDKDQGIDIKG